MPFKVGFFLAKNFQSYFQFVLSYLAGFKIFTKLLNMANLLFIFYSST